MRSGVGLRFLQVAGVLLILGLGLAVLLLADGGWRVFGAWWALVGLTAAVAQVLDRRSRALVPRLTTFEGRPALVLPRRRAPFALGVALLAEVVLGLVVGAAAAAASGRGAVAVLVGALAAYLAWPLGYVAAGRYVAGAVWLSPDGLVSRLNGVELRAAWADVELAVGDDARGYVVLRPRPGARLAHVGRAGPWRGVRTVQTPDLVLLPTVDLAVDPVSLGRLIQVVLHDERARAELGTPASLEALAEVVLSPR